MISTSIQIQRLIILFVILLAPFKSISQENDKAAVTNVSKLTLFNPGFSYERKIGNRQSLYGHIFMNTSFSYSYSSSLGTDFHLYFDPSAALQYRFYYNGNRRAAKDKRTQMNSMNYINAVFQSVFSKHPFYTGISETHYRAINSLGLVWGFQRNYQKRFSLDLYAGLGYTFARSIYQLDPQVARKGFGTISPLGQINIGFWLNKKR